MGTADAHEQDEHEEYVSDHEAYARRTRSLYRAVIDAVNRHDGMFGDLMTEVAGLHGKVDIIIGWMGIPLPNHVAGLPPMRARLPSSAEDTGRHEVVDMDDALKRIAKVRVGRDRAKNERDEERTARAAAEAKAVAAEAELATYKAKQEALAERNEQREHEQKTFWQRYWMGILGAILTVAGTSLVTYLMTKATTPVVAPAATTTPATSGH